jgi:hypothetical protein
MEPVSIGLTGEEEVRGDGHANAIIDEPNNTSITNPRSASNHERTQENFFTLPPLCHNETTMGK